MRWHGPEYRIPVLHNLWVMLVRASFLASLLSFSGRLTSSQMSRSIAVSATGEADGSGLVDSQYPGTAVQRMLNIRERVKSLKPEQLSADWGMYIDIFNNTISLNHYYPGHKSGGSPFYSLGRGTP